MKKVSFLFIQVILIIFFILSLNQDKPWSEIIEDISPSIVKIKTNSGQGSGFFIDKQLIATNYHVIEDADFIKINKIDKDKQFMGQMVAYDPDRDLAIIKVTSTKARPLPLSVEMPKGEEIKVIGNPGGGFEGTVTTGNISAIKRWNETTLIQIDAAINRGNSGGPVILRDGSVIGIATAKVYYDRSENSIEGIGFCVSAKDLINLIDRKTGYWTGGDSDLLNAALNVVKYFFGVFILLVVIFLSRKKEFRNKISNLIKSYFKGWRAKANPSKRLLIFTQKQLGKLWSNCSSLFRDLKIKFKDKLKIKINILKYNELQKNIAQSIDCLEMEHYEKALKKLQFVLSALKKQSELESKLDEAFNQKFKIKLFEKIRRIIFDLEKTINFTKKQDKDNAINKSVEIIKELNLPEIEILGKECSSLINKIVFIKKSKDKKAYRSLAYHLNNLQAYKSYEIIKEWQEKFLKEIDEILDSVDAQLNKAQIAFSRGNLTATIELVKEIQNIISDEEKIESFTSKIENRITYTKDLIKSAEEDLNKETILSLKASIRKARKAVALCPYLDDISNKIIGTAEKKLKAQLDNKKKKWDRITAFALYCLTLFLCFLTLFATVFFSYQKAKPWIEFKKTENKLASADTIEEKVFFLKEYIYKPPLEKKYSEKAVIMLNALKLDLCKQEFDQLVMDVEKVKRLDEKIILFEDYIKENKTNELAVSFVRKSQEILTDLKIDLNKKQYEEMLTSIEATDKVSKKIILLNNYIKANSLNDFTKEYITESKNKLFALIKDAQKQEFEKALEIANQTQDINAKIRILKQYIVKNEKAPSVKIFLSEAEQMIANWVSQAYKEKFEKVLVDVNYTNGYLEKISLLKNYIVQNESNIDLKPYIIKSKQMVTAFKENYVEKNYKTMLVELELAKTLSEKILTVEDCLRNFPDTKYVATLANRLGKLKQRRLEQKKLRS